MRNPLIRVAAVGALALSIALSGTSVALADGPDHKHGGGSGKASAEVKHDKDRAESRAEAKHEKDKPEARAEGKHETDRAETRADHGEKTQGKSKSDPDGMTNAYGGSTGLDKPGYDGGKNKHDQDGNNGCGNDSDREDDNRGNCGGPAKAHDKDKDKDRDHDKAKNHDGDKDTCGQPAKHEGSKGSCPDDNDRAATDGDHDVVICSCVDLEGKAWVTVVVKAKDLKAHLDRGAKLPVNGSVCPPSADTGGNTNANVQTGGDTAVADTATNVSGQISNPAPVNAPEVAAPVTDSYVEQPDTIAAATNQPVDEQPQAMDTAAAHDDAVAKDGQNASDTQVVGDTAAQPQGLPTAGDPLARALAMLGILSGILMITAGASVLYGQRLFADRS